MKSLWIFLFVTFSSLAYSQGIHQTDLYQGLLSNLYISHQPSAKGEAMGRGLVANYDGEFGSYYNPALTSLGSGVSISKSHTFLYTNDVYYDYKSAGYSNKKTGSFSFSKNNWINTEPTMYKPQYDNSIYTINYSKEILQGFYGGLNFNIVRLGYRTNYDYSNRKTTFTDNTSESFTLDIGVLKQFNLVKSSDGKTTRIFQAGASLFNLNKGRISYSDRSEQLPVIFRAGMGYLINFSDAEKNSELSSVFRSFTHFEYESTLNDDQISVIKIGEEIILGDFFILRGGFISSGRYEYANPISKPEITFGAGFKVQFNKIFKSSDSLIMILDYAGMPPTTSKSNTANVFILWGLSANYIP